jgi:hypothetical protein
MIDEAKIARWRKVVAQISNDPARDNATFVLCEALPALLAEREGLLLHSSPAWAAQEHRVICERDQARADRADLLALLKQVEFVLFVGADVPRCPSCGMGRKSGHARDCRLAALLK